MGVSQYTSYLNSGLLYFWKKLSFRFFTSHVWKYYSIFNNSTFTTSVLLYCRVLQEHHM